MIEQALRQIISDVIGDAVKENLASAFEKGAKHGAEKAVEEIKKQGFIEDRMMDEAEAMAFFRCSDSLLARYRERGLAYIPGKPCHYMLSWCIEFRENVLKFQRNRR
jgi:hypothetical protein